MTHLGFPVRETPLPVALSAPINTIDAASRPLVLVLEAEPLLIDILSELAQFLRVDVECVPTIGALETALRTQKPIGLLAHTPDADSAAWSALRAVAHIDPGLPVLLVTGQCVDADTCDPVVPRQPLTNLYWIDQPPGMRAIVDFLFLAERRNISGPMPRLAAHIG